MSAETKLVELGIDLPPAPPPMGVYKPIVVVGNVAYLSGHGPIQKDGSLSVGRVGQDMDLEGGYAAARLTGLALLATIRENLGSLDKVKRVVKTLGLVNSTNDFLQQPQVINGCSELFAELYGDDRGVGTRSAIATNVLPGNIPVEIEMIIEVE